MKFIKEAIIYFIPHILISVGFFYMGANWGSKPNYFPNMKPIMMKYTNDTTMVVDGKTIHYMNIEGTVIIEN